MPTQAFPFYGSREAANRAAYRMACEVDCDPPDDRAINIAPANLVHVA